MLGIDALMVAGENLFALLPPPYDGQYLDQIKQLGTNGNPVKKIEMKLSSKDHPISVVCYALPVYDQNKEIVSIKIAGKINN
jgi:hypothetical protein